MIEVVQQKRIIRLAFRSHSVVRVSRIMLLVLAGVPMLGIGRITDYCIHIERLIDMVFVKKRPVLFQCITIACYDIIRFYTAHHKIHAGKVIGVFFQLLRVILDVVAAAHVSCAHLANVYQQGTGATRRIVNLDLLPSSQMIGNDFGHQK